MQGNDGGELLNYVNAHVIFQAGVDFESKPMVVFCACNLPNPKVVDYDRLLNLIIFRLDEFVENDYTVVLFTSGAKYNPGWNWLSKAYKRLDRKYRKNVKSMYVVHPSMWSKLIFQIFGKIVSPKFFAKVTWVDTLSHLANLVPLSQISIPQPVYDYNMTVEQAITLPPQMHQTTATQVFGVPLDVLMHDGTGILPRPVRECISFIRYNGLATEGLFRRSPPSTALRSAKEGYNRDLGVDLTLSGVHAAAVLLKLFFRELPSPVFGGASYDTVLALPSVQPMDVVRARYVEEVILPSLTIEYRQLLCFTCALLNVVARNTAVNKMTPYNLAVVWAPNLARSSNPVADVAMCS
ncbi:RhoGAP-domain-containing protein, partial [Martensiomyces pterosporus]